MELPVYPKLHIPEEDRSTAITQEQGEFIYGFLREKQLQKTLEIGLGYGTSAAHIMAATEDVHYVIVPFQEVRFANRGFINLQQLGFEDR